MVSDNSIDKHHRLCYTEATIFEIQRLGSIAPQAVPHRTLADVTSGRNQPMTENNLLITLSLSSQRLQDSQGHLCFLNALLHHEVVIVSTYHAFPPLQRPRSLGGAERI